MSKEFLRLIQSAASNTVKLKSAATSSIYFGVIFFGISVYGLLRGDPTLRWYFEITGFVALGVPGIVNLYLALFKPDYLRRETFHLNKIAIEALGSKEHELSPPQAEGIALIANPEKTKEPKEASK